MTPQETQPTGQEPSATQHKRAIALIGVGKIARDQHIPALERHSRFRLEALVSLDACDIDLPTYRSVEEMAKAMPQIEAVSICTPPDCRLDIVAQAISANLHIMLEKPTAATIAKAKVMEAMAKHRSETIFASWHSRHAAGISALKHWLRRQSVSQIEVTWKEDMRIWHPGQEWIFSSGFGVFDPAVNAFSILTEILEEDFFFSRGDIIVPENRAAPISADLHYSFAGRPGGVHLEVDFDCQNANPDWTILIQCESGCEARLEQGGAILTLPDEFEPSEQPGEYDSLYSKFDDLIVQSASEFDLSPMYHVFDAMALSRRHIGQPFKW